MANPANRKVVYVLAEDEADAKKQQEIASEFCYQDRASAERALAGVAAEFRHLLKILV